MVDTPISKMVAAGTLTGDEPVEIAQISTSVTITGATISAAASDNSFNDSGGGFVAAGFAVGNRVNVTGFTGDVANNIFSGEVTALTAGKMTIGGADGNVIVDDAAGESVTIAKWVSRRSTPHDIAASTARTLIQLQANSSKTTGSFTVHSWASGDIVSDPLETWEAGNPSRITVPAGYSKARITIQPTWASNSTGARWAYARLNADNAKLVQSDVRGAVNEAASVSTGRWIEGLDDGTDYFDFTFAQTSGGNLNLTGAAGFATATHVMIEWAP